MENNLGELVDPLLQVGHNTWAPMGTSRLDGSIQWHTMRIPLTICLIPYIQKEVIHT